MRNKTCRSLFLSLLIAGLTVTPCYAATTQSKILMHRVRNSRLRMI